MYLAAAVERVTLSDTRPAPDGARTPPQVPAPESASLDLVERARAQVDQWPPLSASQRERLSVLLRPGRLPGATP